MEWALGKREGEHPYCRNLSPIALLRHGRPGVGKKGRGEEGRGEEGESEREKAFVWEMGHFPIVILMDYACEEYPDDLLCRAYYNSSAPALLSRK